VSFFLIEGRGKVREGRGRNKDLALWAFNEVFVLFSRVSFFSFDWREGRRNEGERGRNKGGMREEQERNEGGE
jgi:hypothetical protein